MRTISIWKRLLPSLSLLAFAVGGAAQSVPQLLTGGADHNLKWFDTRGMLMLALGAHLDSVTAVAVAPNGGEPLLVSSGADGKLNLWNVNQRRLLRTQDGHRGAITALSISPLARYVATAGADHQVRLWHFVKGKRLAETGAGEARLLGLFFSKDGRLLRGVDEKSLWTWNVESSVKGEVHLTLASHRDLNVGKITAVALSADGKRLALGTENAFVHLWNFTTNTVERKIEVSEFPVSALAFTAEGTSVAAGDERGYLRVWSVSDGKPRRFIVKTFARIRCAVFSLDGATLVTGSEDGTLHYWEPKEGKLRSRQPAHTGAVQCLTLIP